MFAFGLKGRTAECIRRGGHALFLGSFIKSADITRLPLNEEAQSALYFYTAALCLHDLFEQMKTSRCGREPWASIDFFMKNALAGIGRLERERGIPKGALAGHCIQPLTEIGIYVDGGGTVPIQVFAAEVHVIHSGKLGYTSFDEAAPIRAFMKDCQDRFHAETQHMFA